MSKKEMLEQIAILQKQNQEYHKIIKDLDKKMKKNLWWWFCLPLAGFLVFEMFVQKRKQTDEYQTDTLVVKTEIAKNEFQILKLKKQLEELEKTKIKG